MMLLSLLLPATVLLWTTLVACVGLVVFNAIALPYEGLYDNVLIVVGWVVNRLSRLAGLGGAGALTRACASAMGSGPHGVVAGDRDAVPSVHDDREPRDGRGLLGGEGIGRSGVSGGGVDLGDLFGQRQRGSLADPAKGTARWGAMARIRAVPIWPAQPRLPG